MALERDPYEQDVLRRIGRLIEGAMKRRGLTYEALSALIAREGVMTMTDAALNKIVRGRVQTKPSTLVYLGQLLDIPALAQFAPTHVPTIREEIMAALNHLPDAYLVGLRDAMQTMIQPTFSPCAGSAL